MSDNQQTRYSQKICKKKKSQKSWTPKSAFMVRNQSRQELSDSLRLKTMPSSEVKRVKIIKGEPFVTLDDYWFARRKHKDQLIKEMLRDRNEGRSRSLGIGKIDC